MDMAPMTTSPTTIMLHIMSITNTPLRLTPSMGQSSEVMAMTISHTTLLLLAITHLLSVTTQLSLELTTTNLKSQNRTPTWDTVAMTTRHTTMDITLTTVKATTVKATTVMATMVKATTVKATTVIILTLTSMSATMVKATTETTLTVTSMLATTVMPITATTLPAFTTTMTQLKTTTFMSLTTSTTMRSLITLLRP